MNNKNILPHDWFSNFLTPLIIEDSTIEVTCSGTLKTATEGYTHMYKSVDRFLAR
jgi:hypothetical protein